MTYSLALDPLLPWQVIVGMCVVIALTSAILLYRSNRGSILRLVAGTALICAIANPTLQSEQRASLKSTVAIILDESQSQSYGKRKEQTAAALEILKERIARFSDFEVRVVSASKATEDGNEASTRIYAALNEAFRDVPPSRAGGAIIITDGQAHDIPPDAGKGLGFNAPVHSLITGSASETDRLVRFIEAPKFGIAGKPLAFVYRVDDDGVAATGTPVRVQVFLNGELLKEETAITGQNTDLEVEISRAGNNIIELAVDPLPGEISDTNNKAVTTLDGIRENLRVLLVSGEPHAGERTWRNLLKSDASVDLVHFTILRPPEKQDETPITELSLIAFPTRELFVDKINQFDLIIFDRYQHRDVLPLLYYDYITQYVENGGAVLVAAGPEYSGAVSIANTGLAPALPALPTGSVIEQGFYPRLSKDGQRHPVTRGLEGSESEPPKWGRWFRLVDVQNPEGAIVMKGPDDKPLLILNRKGKGRVGMFLSDQGWLWARGFEGGGPYVSLYRRISHWLMKEPELEEEALNAASGKNSLDIVRQSMSDKVDDAKVITPGGQTVTLPLKEAEPGLFRGSLKTQENGLFQIANGDLTTLAHVGPVDAPEFKSIISTEAVLKPLADETRGSVRRLANANGDISVPEIVPVRQTGDAFGTTWLGLRKTDDTELLGITSFPLFGGLIGLALLLAALSSMWWREGR